MSNITIRRKEPSLSFSPSSKAQGGADRFLFLQVINSPIKGNLRSIISAIVVNLASMGGSTSKKTSSIEKRSTKRICLDLESEKDSLEYEKEQFNRQMKKEKEIMRRAQWKSEAEIKISREKSDKERKRLGSEKEVEIARAKDISNRETAMEKREFMARKRHDALEKREDAVEKREDAVEKREDAVGIREEEVEKRERAVEMRKDAVEKREEEVEKREGAVEKREEKVKEGFASRGRQRRR